MASVDGRAMLASWSTWAPQVAGGRTRAVAAQEIHAVDIEVDEDVMT